MLLSWFSNWLLVAPLWAIGLVAFTGMALAALAGRAFRRRRDRADTAGRNPDSEQSMTVSAVMGLLALLIAFTFSIAIDRFDKRRINVLLEANAIGTTYLRAQLLDEPHRARMSRLLVEYTDTRLVLARSAPGPAQTGWLEKSDRLVADLWTATVSAFPSMRSYPYSNAFIEAMNNLIDMDTARKAGRQAHVPAAVFLVLFLYQFMAAGVISYVVVGRSSRHTALILFVLLGVLLVLIIDVDRPTGGGVTESQAPMQQLQQFLKANPPRMFDRFTASIPPPR